MNSSSEPSRTPGQPVSTVSLETLIAMGLFGWLALSITLMGLGIW